jgi:hypothetical protein
MAAHGQIDLLYWRAVLLFPRVSSVLSSWRAGFSVPFFPARLGTSLSGVDIKLSSYCATEPA